MLVRDGLSLTVSAGVTSAVGMLAWVVAARLLDRTEVGQASAFVSGFLLVAGLGDLGLGAALMRWVPRAGHRRVRLVLRCYAVVVAASVAAALVVLALPTGDEISEVVPRLGTVLFVFASVCWALFQFQDAVLIALGRARWVPYENTSIGVGRVTILVLVGPLLGSAGVLLSWVLPAIVGVLVVSALVLRLLLTERLPANPGRPSVLPDRREVFRLLGPTYPAKVCAGILTDLVPLLVIGRFGPASGAVFFVVWMAGNTVDYAALSFAHSVIVRIAHEPERTAELFRIGCRNVAILFVPGLCVGVALAGPLLSVFGPAYADFGTDLLRLVLLGCVPRLLTTLVVALNLAHGRGWIVALLEAGSAIGVIGFVAYVPPHQLDWVGIGFVAVQIAVAAGAALLARQQLSLGRQSIPRRTEMT